MSNRTCLHRRVFFFCVVRCYFRMTVKDRNCNCANMVFRVQNLQCGRTSTTSSYLNASWYTGAAGLSLCKVQVKMTLYDNITFVRIRCMLKGCWTGNRVSHIQGLDLDTCAAHPGNLTHFLCDRNVTFEITSRHGKAANTWYVVARRPRAR